MNAANVAKFVADIKSVAVQAKPSCDQLVESLRKLLPTLSDNATATPRYRTALATKLLVDAVKESGDSEVVHAIVNADVASSGAAMGTNLKKAADLVVSLSQVKWQLLEAINRLQDQRAAAAKPIWDYLKESFEKDEYAVALAPVLTQVENRATSLLTEVPAPPPVTPSQPPTTPPVPKPVASSHVVISQGSSDAATMDEIDEIVDEIRRAMKSEDGARLKMDWEVYKQ
jgi:hypothetical protein